MSTKNCPECGSDNPVSEDMCDQCGALLGNAVPAAAPATTAPTPTPAAQVGCHNCGKSVSADMRFCDGCGANLQAPPPPPAPEPEPVVVPDPEPVMAPPPDQEPVPDVEPEPLPPVPAPVQTAPVPADPAATTKSGKPKSWKLACVEGFRLGKEYLIYKDEMMLGRLDAENDCFPDIELEDQDDGYVSRRHARITLRDGSVYVEDLGGENGTLLDGRPLPALKAFEIQEGQVIRLGKVGLMLRAFGEVSAS